MTQQRHYKKTMAYKETQNYYKVIQNNYKETQKRLQGPQDITKRLKKMPNN